MEYRIKESHRLRLPIYLTPSFNTRAEAEGHLNQIIADNIDPDLVYAIVYGRYYTQGAENGTFAEFPESN